MQLIYRGAIYNYDPANAPIRRPVERKSPYKLIYRGSTYWVDPNAIASTAVEPVVYELIYRGHRYQVSRNSQRQVTAIASSTNSSKHRKSMNDRPAIQ
jgi:Domain of unknown function (DUF4278)